MNPRMGRPPKSITKNVQLTIRIGEESANLLKECAKILDTSRTEVLEYGIRLVKQELDGQKK